MRLFGTTILLLAALLATASTASAFAAEDVNDVITTIINDPASLVQDEPDPTVPPDQGQDGSEGRNAPGFADSVRDAFKDQMVMVSAAGLAAALLGMAGFALVTRYVSPKEALKNPQRAMLYGFVRATPGAHLKQLSEEFGMKSSSILWHIRKLESADLVRSERANGYRVFYPVEGGIELRRVSRALSALQNDNARRVLGHLARHPGSNAGQIARATTIHPGTVRWHLRKLRDFGILEELVSDEPSKFFTTPLGRRSLESLEGRSTGDNITQGATSPVPMTEA